MIIQRYSSQPIVAQIAGVTFERRQSVVAGLSRGDNVDLLRDPNNAFDRNAIKVLTQDGREIGFLSRNLAALLADDFDRYGQPVLGKVEAILGAQYPGSNLGVLIRFYLPGDERIEIDQEETITSNR